MKIDVKKRETANDEHYTTIEIGQLHNELKGRTLAKIPQFIRSMYRRDIREDLVSIYWQNERLMWEGHEENILAEPRTGKPYKKEFAFNVNKKHVHGWVAILDRGSRSDAGFVIFHCGRIVDGVPTGYRPKEIFGQEGGTNNLVNQRLFGELHLDDFDVTHTKDAILWQSDDEECLGDKLREECAGFIRVAADRRKTTAPNPDERGPSAKDVQLAIDEFKAEITSSEMIDAVRIKRVPPAEVVHKAKRQLLKKVTASSDPAWAGRIDNLSIKIFLESLSADDPYVTSESASQNDVVVVVNRAHPHWNQIEGDMGVLNYIRHCVYDALAEWKAQQLTQTIDPDTVKRLKDEFLRVPLYIEEHERQDGARK